MERVFIVGATGGVGSRLARQLVDRGDQVVGLCRRIDQRKTLEVRGVKPVLGDLAVLTEAELANYLQDIDTVVFAAGASDDGPRVADVVDGQGVVLCTGAAAQAGVPRFLHVSAFPDAWRDRRMPTEFEHYMKLKRQADICLAATALNWVIVRPGTLTNLPGTGRVRLGAAIPYGDVSRDDVAGVLAELVHAKEVRRVILELTAGGTPITQALREAIAG